MEIVNLLDFLNKAKDLYTLDYVSCEHDLINFLDLVTEDEQFTQKIDLGILYISPITLEQYTIIDGLGRLLSLSLLLHAVCECYKKTTPRNDSAIKTIRNKYLLDGNSTKLKLPNKEQIIYNKIIFGERLSGNEKETPMFRLLHSFWSQIKEEKLQAAYLFKMLKKVYITVVSTTSIPHRDLYYTLNKDRREIKQLPLIENYLKNIGIIIEWENLKAIFNNNVADIELFFKDFFVTKFNYKLYSSQKLYVSFTNYFETMLQYMSEDVLIAKLIRSAQLYNNILNVNVETEKLKKALIQIKMHNGDDTYAYILNIYEDFIDGNLSEATFLEILSTIDEYLKNRVKTPNSVNFNELIAYLNAFITCK